MVSREEARKNSKEVIPNCKVVEESGVVRVVCEPVVEKGGEKLPVCDRPVVGRVTRDYGGKPIIALEDDGGCAPEVIVELDKYFSMIGKTLQPSGSVVTPTKEEIKKVV